MSIIICYNDMTGRGLFKRSLDILAEAHQEEQLAIPESILTSAQSVCYHEVIWSLMRAKDKEVEQVRTGKGSCYLVISMWIFLYQAAIAELIEMRDTYFTSIAPLITRSDIPDMAARVSRRLPQYRSAMASLKMSFSFPRTVFYVGLRLFAVLLK